MKLFLNHASEEKDFVRQLYGRLKAEGYDVWFDEKSMTLGDSLIQKINEGLTTCDYAVVVLSSTFFGKKWTTAELGGLMALESETRKIILPVWKDISAEEVAKLMPTMADRVAINASAGLDAVVAAIKYTVSGAEMQRKQSRADQLKARLDKMGANSKARRDADLLLNSHDGARRLRAEITGFGELLIAQFAAFSSDELKFSANQTRDDSWNVQGPRRYAIDIRFVQGASNTAAYAELVCIFYRIGELKHFGERADPTILKTLKFYPYFDGTGTVVWSATEKREETMGTSDLLLDLASTLTDYVEKAK